MSKQPRRAQKRDPSLVLPLPKELRKLLEEAPRDGDNLGLWLDKFVRVDEHDWSLKGPERARELERLFCPYHLGAPRAWRSTAAADTIERLQASCRLVYGDAHRSLVVRVHGRLLVDYGRASAIETSLSLHPALGCPRIPGSALKGVLRTHLRDSLAHDKPRLRELLGAPDAGTKEDVDHLRGRLVIHDALPEAGEFQLALDVLTPHAGDYYEGKNHTPPADWLSPRPHTFLTVVETSFRVFMGMLPAPQSSAVEEQEVLAMAERALTDVLANEGVGAKRAAGYGRLRKVSDG